MYYRQACLVFAFIALVDNTNAFGNRMSSDSFIPPSITKSINSIHHIPFTNQRIRQPHGTAISLSSDADENIPAPVKKTPPPRDMNYIPTNIVRQLENYKNIRNVGGADTINDVYVRDPETNVFWFAGKVARCTGTVSLEQAVARQWNFIEEHACRLRVAELSRKFGTLEIWTAPGDSELDVAYNRPHIQFVKMTKRPDYCVKEVKAVEIGFESEIYEEGEEGFRTLRTEDGLPMNDEIQTPE